MKGAECIDQVRNIVHTLSMPSVSAVRMGEVELSGDLAMEDLFRLQEKLRSADMDILSDRKQILAEKIRHTIYRFLNDKNLPQHNYSAYLAEKLNLSYSYLANIFSDTQHISIEQFIIAQKVAKAEQLLMDSNYNISEVADLLQYKSIAHFSHQFKKITGYTPSEYKRQMQDGLGDK